MKTASRPFLVGSLLIAFSASNAVAWADEWTPPVPDAGDAARCRTLGAGYVPIKGSAACIRISGYVWAGAALAEPGRLAPPTSGPFATHASIHSVGGSFDAPDAQAEPSFGSARVYVEHGAP